jgi:hypothetical protein
MMGLSEYYHFWLGVLAVVIEAGLLYFAVSSALIFGYQMKIMAWLGM